jgi:hypothetical protein
MSPPPPPPPLTGWYNYAIAITMTQTGGTILMTTAVVTDDSADTPKWYMLTLADMVHTPN